MVDSPTRIVLSRKGGEGETSAKYIRSHYLMVMSPNGHGPTPWSAENPRWKINGQGKLNSD